MIESEGIDLLLGNKMPLTYANASFHVPLRKNMLHMVYTIAIARRKYLNILPLKEVTILVPEKFAIPPVIRFNVLPRKADQKTKKIINK